MTKRMNKKSNPDRLQTLSGIDKLNYQLKINYNDYTSFYNKFILTDVISNDEELEFITEGKQYHIFRCTLSEANEGIARHSLPDWFCFIKFKNLNQKDCLESISVEINSVILQLYSVSEIHEILVNKINSFGLNVEDTKLSRVDLNSYVYGYSFDWISVDYFSTNARHSNDIRNNRVLDTFYLGSRNTNAILLRVYNKWKELKETQSLDDTTKMLKKDILKAKFKHLKGVEIDESIPLWNVEFEIKREKLKSYQLERIEDLEKLANSLFSQLCNKNRLLERITSKGDTNRNKLQTHPIWEKMARDYKINNEEKIDINMITKKKYYKDEMYTVNRLNEIIEENKNKPSKAGFVEILQETKRKIFDLLKEEL